jgi:uncharacterized protein DUF4339
VGQPGPRDQLIHRGEIAQRRIIGKDRRATRVRSRAGPAAPVGPLPLADPRKLLSLVADSKDVLVWRSGFAGWKRADLVPDLIPPTPPPIPRSVSISTATQPTFAGAKAGVERPRKLAFRKLLTFILSMTMLIVGLYWAVGELLSSQAHGRALKLMLLAGIFPAILGAYLLSTDFIAPALGIKTGEDKA